ncbi:MAG: hypothetical protein ACMXYM_00215 [Candidatus Woesearchaeota archaeon]
MIVAFSSSANRHNVLWKLTYTDTNSIERVFVGTYLIELDNGVCTFFHQCSEEHEQSTADARSR